MTKYLPGSVISTFAFILWGLLPLYFQFVPNADVLELLAVRVLVSIPLMLLLLRLIAVPWPKIVAAFTNKKILGLCFLAGLFNCISLYSFTWALTNDQVLAASLGYFINPIFSIVFGVLFLKDKLTLGQKMAVVLSICGIGYQVVQYGELPWVSLIMGGAFALYGLVKKYISLDSISAMLLELVTLAPIAVGILYYGWLNQDSVIYAQDWQALAWYAGSGPVTLVPLVLFAMAVERTSLIVVGLTQYIEPSIQFLLAVAVFGEQLDPVKVVSFSCIWLGLIVCSIEAAMRARSSRMKPLRL